MTLNVTIDSDSLVTADRLESWYEYIGVFDPARRLRYTGETISLTCGDVASLVFSYRYFMASELCKLAAVHGLPPNRKAEVRATLQDHKCVRKCPGNIAPLIFRSLNHERHVCWRITGRQREFTAFPGRHKMPPSLVATERRTVTVRPVLDFITSHLVIFYLSVAR